MSNLTWVGSRGASFVTSAASIALALPAGLQANDGVFAFVMGRSALTAPAGWTLIRSVSFTGAGVTQNAYMYQKDAVAVTDSSLSVTWTQAVADRMGVTYAAVRGSGKKPFVQQTAVSFLENTAYTIASPVLTAERSNEIILSCASTVGTATSGTVTPTVPTGMTIFSGASVAAYRIMGAYQLRGNGQSNGGSWNTYTAGTGTTNALGAITARIIDNDFGPGGAGTLTMTRSSPILEASYPASTGSRVTIFHY